ncbi:Digestive organ expansion factor [Phytophthora palmivora]|uniref:Digestive organ expansion factor n=1 Tax=Phytophthora palmivora TaxID=4796 RepID=A0A2P4XIC4_9STRA|nr:Digestive organ expansion factor [Phytophthora palmivora]
MGPRKEGGKKKGSRKRKANVWDDAEPKIKRGAISSGNEAKPRKNGSMMGQWKAQKIAERAKERKFFASVDEKKRWQREQYEDKWEHTANAIYKDGSEDLVEQSDEDEKEMQSEESDSDEDDLGNKNSVFHEFVNTFKPMEPTEEEEEEEEEYEEVVVDENGEEVDEEETEEVQEFDEGKEDEEQIAAMEKDDEEQMEKDEDEQEDPYRRRYLLSSFTELDAKRFDAQTRKFAKVTLPTLQEEAYDVTYRNGVDADVGGVAGVVISPETAEKKKSYTYENTTTLRQLSVMHVLNHVLKARDTVTRNNERIKKRDSGKNGEQGDDEEKEYLPLWLS